MGQKFVRRIISDIFLMGDTECHAIFYTNNFHAIKKSSDEISIFLDG